MTDQEGTSVWYVQHYAGGPGIGRYHRGHHLATALRPLGWRLSVVAASFHHLMNEATAKPPRMDVDGVPYHFVPTPPYEGNGVGRIRNMWRFGTSVRQALRASGEQRPRVLVYSSPHLFGAAVVERACRSLGLAFVLEVRDLWPLSFHELMGMSRSHPLYWYVSRLERHAYARADAVVSLLPASRDYMEGHGLAPGKWHYVPNGVAQEEQDSAAPCPPELNETLARLRSEGRRIVGYAGAMGVPNGCEMMANALAGLDGEERARIALVMVGAGSEKARLEELARRQDLPMVFFPQMGKAKVWSFLADVDAGIIVLPRKALFEYGVSPNKIFDYFLAGRPVIQALTAGNDPVVEAGAGWSGPAEDVESLTGNLRAFLDASDETLADRGRAGRRWVLASHEYASLAARYDEVLRGVLPEAP